MFKFICYFPLLISLLYSIYLLLKKPSQEDQFFHLSPETKKESMIGRIKILEQLNGSDYGAFIKDIEKYYADGKITESEEEKMERIITNTYFNRFNEKWAAFKKADISMKMMFILMLMYGFVYVNLVVMYGYDKLHDPGMSKTTAIVLANATLILPLVFGVLMLGILNMVLTFFSSCFGQFGGISRAAITCDELIMSLKPGGREMKVIVVKDFYNPRPWEL